MRIAKPILMVTTPAGLVGGFYEAYRLTDGLVWLMVAMVAVLTAFVAFMVGIARREQRNRTRTGDPRAASPGEDGGATR